MKMSCNGCRALRKGCSKDCTLGPSLQWIKSPASQANATVFLAKFYGRAGLINLLNAGPNNLRPEICRSLLYEACGRIINPVHGSVGLVCSGNWKRCEEAVEAVLRGTSVVLKRVNDDHENSCAMPLQGCDIRHLSKEYTTTLHRISRKRFKCSSSKIKSDPMAFELLTGLEPKFTITGWNYHDEDCKDLIRDSLSGETQESGLLNQVQQPVRVVTPEFRPSDIRLDLTLGLNPVIEISDSES